MPVPARRMQPATEVTVAGTMTESRNVDRAARIALYERLIDEFS